MDEQINLSEAVSEIKESSEDELRAVIERWFETTRTSGLKLGAQMISIAVYDAIQKNIVAKDKPSLRDYKRAIEGILKIVKVPLTKQNDEKGEN